MTLRDDELSKVAGGVGKPSMAYYTVAKGDNLHSIAGRYRNQGYAGVTWDKILEWNRDLIKTADTLLPGWRLRIFLIP